MSKRKHITETTSNLPIKTKKIQTELKAVRRTISGATLSGATLQDTDYKDVLNKHVDNMMIKDLRVIECSESMYKQKTIKKTIITYCNYIGWHQCSNELISEFISFVSIILTVKGNIDNTISTNVIFCIKNIEEKYYDIFIARIKTIFGILNNMKLDTLDEDVTDDTRYDFNSSVSMMVNLGFRHTQYLEEILKLVKDGITNLVHLEIIETQLKYKHETNEDSKKKLDRYMFKKLNFCYKSYL